VSSKKSKHRKPQAPAEARSTPPATKEPTPDHDAAAERAAPAATGAAPRFSSWRTQALVAASVLVIGVGGVLIGRASVSQNASAGTAKPAVSAIGSSGLQAFESNEPWPPAFELTPDPDQKGPGGADLRPMDRDIFDKLITLNVERSQIRDVFPDRPYRVQFVGSLAERHIGTVLIDIDRDGTIDERWDIKHGSVNRMVPKDPAAGGYQVGYLLSHGRWKVR
jgi:hypothetical protein